MLEGAGAGSGQCFLEYNVSLLLSVVVEKAARRMKLTGDSALSDELNHGSTADGAGTKEASCVHLCGLVGGE